MYTSSDKPLYPGLLTDIPGNSAASYTLSLTDIPVYNPDDRPLFPALVTDTGVQCLYTLSLNDIPVYIPSVRGLYPGLQIDIQGKSVAYRS